eukprot:15466350-Alexandrium_andersonii.AAC.1
MATRNRGHRHPCPGNAGWARSAESAHVVAQGDRSSYIVRWHVNQAWATDCSSSTVQSYVAPALELLEIRGKP